MATKSEACQALEDALGALSLRATRAGGPGADLVVPTEAGDLEVAVEHRALVTAADVATIATLPGRPRTVVVADRIVAEARDALRARRQSWLDLRGHLFLAGPGVLIDTSVPPATYRKPRIGVFSGPAGYDVACALLLDPDRAWGVRELAAQLDRAASSVSEVFTTLADDGLVAPDRRPRVPDLFWATADAWPDDRIGVSRVPARADADVLDVNDADLARPGWAIGDTVAAAAYGAPLGARADHPPDFHVPSPGLRRRAVTLLGAAVTAGAEAATVRVAPTRLVCARRVDGAPWRSSWPLAHPLFVALDLATDPGRGREVVRGWAPPDWCARVW